MYPLPVLPFSNPSGLDLVSLLEGGLQPVEIGVRKQIEEANLLAKESKEERKRAKVEANGVKEEAKKRAKDTKKRLKEEVSRAKKEKARLEIPKSKGVTWNKRSSKWEVIFCFDGKRRHLGYFDDRVGAVEVHSSYNSQ